MSEGLLNLGSVVEFENRLLTIIGYFPVADDKISLYSAVVYPAGLIDDNSLVLIDEDAEFKVVFDGYEDDESNEFKKSVETLIEELANEDQSEEELDEENALDDFL